MGGPSRTTVYRTPTEAPARPGLLASRDQWRAAATLLLDLIFPPRCVICGRVDTVWCRHCEAAVVTLPLIGDVALLPPISAIAATALHQGHLQSAVHAVKYENTPQVVPSLARRLLTKYAAIGWAVDLVVPVPLHANRQSTRGYNQAHLLAEALAALLGLPCAAEALVRERDTRSQVGLDRAGRQANVEGAFVGERAILNDRRILLIDDVYTTGATLRACAQAALDAGSTEVFGLTVTVAD